MAKVFIEETTLTAIGDAIREKTGKTDLIDPAKMSNEIESIEAGGGGADIPEEAYKFTGNLTYTFAEGNWDWFIEQYGSKITTEDVTSLNYTFNYSKVSEIPFTINVTKAKNFSSAFANCPLTKCPKIRGTFDVSASSSFTFSSIFSNAIGTNLITSLDDLFEPEMFEAIKTLKITSQYNAPYAFNFAGIRAVRTIPEWWYQWQLNPESTAFPAAHMTIYSSMFSGCMCLDEAHDIPVWACVAPATSNLFSSAFTNMYRIKSITFETDNGQPKIANWKGQILELSASIGYGASAQSVGKYMATKLVDDDETYQTYKNDPDYYTAHTAYSRYNHDSAVETINSLPDTSAYLASAGGTNTIKFLGVAGAKTDGGAINTLTAEEIAVATAKGWTVTLV